MKTCSSVVKIISDVENDFMQNQYNNRMNYRYVLRNYNNTNMGLSAIAQWTVIHLHYVDMIDMHIQN